MREVADAATQSNIKRQDKWVDGKPMKVTKKKYKVLCMVKICKVIHQHIMSIVLVENCLAEDL